MSVMFPLICPSSSSVKLSNSLVNTLESTLTVAPLVIAVLALTLNSNGSSSQKNPSNTLCIKQLY